VQRFAAHLAHLLNDGEKVVTVEAFKLFLRLTGTLERREHGADSGPYDSLTGLKLLGPGTTPQEASHCYVDRVLKRPLHLARDEPAHKGHALFLTLCRRGIDSAWPEADLARMRSVSENQATTPPAEFAGIKERLARVSPEISDGNPAKSTRAASGPLYLRVGGAATEVAEELSMWDAMTCAPSRLNALARGPAFNAFCSIMIKALEAANARYGTLIALGLSPRDWEELSVNTAKKLSSFLSAARALGAPHKDEDGPDHAERGRGKDTLANWERAWEKRQVPGFDSARDLWNSQLGHALRHGQVPIMVDIDNEPVKDADQYDEKVLDPMAFETMVARAQDAGVLSPYDAWLVRQLSQGETITTLVAAPETRREFKKDNVSKKMLEDYMARLGERTRAFAHSLAGG
jgi:hypothetical protein